MDNKYLQSLRGLIANYTKDYPVRVYLFGSRATGKAHKLSDVDLAILSIQPLPVGFIANLREKIEESTIPYKVDLVDLSQVDDTFRKKYWQRQLNGKIKRAVRAHKKNYLL
jgi:predicted nucleotidyltransferase